MMDPAIRITVQANSTAAVFAARSCCAARQAPKTLLTNQIDHSETELTWSKLRSFRRSQPSYAGDPGCRLAFIGQIAAFPRHSSVRAAP